MAAAAFFFAAGETLTAAEATLVEHTFVVSITICNDPYMIMHCLRF